MAIAASERMESVERLKSAGMTEKQAEEIVRLIDIQSDSAVTREYLETRLATLEARLEAKFEKSLGDAKTSIVMWAAGMLIAQAGLVVTLVKLLP